MTTRSADRRMTDAGDESALASLFDALIAQLQAGERVDLEAVAREHPEFAREIRQLGPAMEALVGFHESRSADAVRRAGTGEEIGLASGVLGDFRLVSEVGRGGMGVVFEAEQISLRRRVALKILPLAAVLDERHLTRFRKEAQAAGQLHHTNIVPVYAVGSERGVHYYAMQFIDGQPLTAVLDGLRRMGRTPETPGRDLSFAMVSGDFDAPPANPGTTAPDPDRTVSLQPASVRTEPAPTVRTGPPAATGSAVGGAVPSPETSDARTYRCPAYLRSVARLGIQAADALEHAHSRGVIHRDIKPANLLLDGRGNLWVADFGLARLQDDRGLTLTGDVLGTLRYMSPEQATGSKALDHRTDVYSLGVTLYEMLALRPAIVEKGHSQILRAIASEEPPPLRRLNRGVSKDLETIIAKAMAKDPSRRYATAGAMAEDLRASLELRPIAARRPSPVERATRWVRRHRVFSTAACVVVAALAVAGASALAAHDRRLKQVEAELGRRRAEEAEQAARIAALGARVDALIEEAQRLGSGRHPDFPRAVALLSEAIAQRPKDPSLYLYRGSAHHEMGRHAEAIADLERSLELSTAPNPAAHWVIALAALQLGQEGKARQHQDRAERDDPNNVQSLVAQALALGHDERGLELLDRAIDREPFDPTLYFYRGRIAANLTFRHGEKRFYELAVADLEKALLARPGDPKILEPLCDLLLNGTYLGDVSGWSRARERAGRLLEEWRRLRPTDLAARRQMMGNALQHGDFNLCLEEARACRRLAPDDPTFPLNMAWACVLLHDLDAAERHYDEAARLERSVLILTGRAACRGWHRGDREKTIRELAELRREFPPETWTYSDWMHFRNAYVMMKDWDSTLAVCEDYLRRVPGASEVHLWRGNALRETGDIKGALASLTRALELNPDHWHIYQVRGWTHVRGRDYEAALADVDRFIGSPSVRPKIGQATPDQMAKLAEAVAGRGSILRAAGRPAEAEQSERDALALHLKIEGDGLIEGITAHSNWDTMVHYGQLAELIPRLCQPDEIPAIFRAIRADPPRHATAEAVAELGDLFSQLALMLAKTDASGDQERAWRRAIVAYEKACGVGEAPPRWSRLLARCHAELAELLRSTERGDEAQEQDRKAAEVAGRWRTAAERMLASQPDNASEADGVAWWLVSWPVPAMRDGSRAVELARKTVAGAPDSAPYRGTLGAALYRVGHWDEAVEVLGRARELLGKDEPRSAFFLAMALWQRGDHDAARAQFERAVATESEPGIRNEEWDRLHAEAKSLIAVPDPPDGAKPPGEAKVKEPAS